MRVASMMRGRRLVLLAAALGACASGAAALPVHVSLDWPHGVPASEHPAVSIRAVQTAGPHHGGAPVEAAAGPDGAVLNLGDGVWQLHASAPGYWSQSVEVAVADQPVDSARLVLWPAASLHGVVATAAGETLPDSLEVQMSAVAPSDV